MTLNTFSDNLEWIVVGVPAFLLAIKFVYATVRTYDINKRFVRDVAENHLPHLQHAVTQIAHRLGIELEDPPPIRFVDFDKEK